MSAATRTSRLPARSLLATGPAGAVLRATGALALSAALLAGCAASGGSGAGAGSGSAATSPAAETGAGTSALTIADGWAKAGEAGGMTAVFGTLENRGGSEATITGVSSDAAGSVELHETVDGRMREMSDEVSIPAGGSFALEPGANHIMLMDLAEDLLAGDEVTVSIALSDGSTADLTVLVKDYAGANEEYDGGMDHDGDMDQDGAMDHDGAEHDHDGGH